ncbi:hypothetical protein [Clostridium tarantellae]|nr:hypothetical protein [Clostridium tarantellae]
MNLPKKVKGIKLVQEEINLQFSVQNNEINFNTLKIYRHEMIELVY